ncbi:hypothetical protein [Roseomonas sp. BN140053]|uniref:hypothetical protein n=1 Tax=Roseomonas sp. BN140053 TaxID=3391898 RepID=UPI0039E7E64C
MTRLLGAFAALALLSALSAFPAAAQEAAAPAVRAPAEAQAPGESARPAPARRRPAQRRPRRASRPPVREATPEPLPPAVVTAPAPVQRGERAPMPNRDLEMPRTAGSDDGRTTFSPSLIQPRETPGGGGGTLGPDDLARRGDRLFREPAAGGTLRVPFAY